MKTPPRFFVCCFLLGAFVIDSPQHCGTSAHSQLALRFLQQGQYERALQEAQRAMRQRRGDASLHLIAALAHWGRNEIPQAVDALAQGLRLDPDHEQLHATLRDICRQERRFDLARETLSALLEIHPGNIHLLAGLGWAYMHLGEDERAIELLEAAAGAAEVDLFAHFQLGRLYLRNQRIDEAIQVLKRALEAAPDNVRILLSLGECHLRQGRGGEAEQRFARALEKSENPSATATRIAQIYYDAGMRRRAIDYYERAMQQDDPSPLLLNNLAWTYAEEGIELERATRLAQDAVKSEPDNPVYLDTYAELFYIKGQYGRAIALMRRALEAEPENGEHTSYLQEQMRKFRRAAGDSLPF